MFARIRILSLVAVIIPPVVLLLAAPVPPGAKSKLADTEEAVPATAAEQEKARHNSTGNLKQIGLAVHNHVSAYSDKVPRDVVDKDGKPLLSWRVQILPSLEEDTLYKHFKLDEPWDSPDNIKLLERMPKVFDSPRVKLKTKGYTVYQGFTGNGAVINGPYSIGNIPDGSANTIWCVEATAAVPWTKPADIPFDPKKDLPKFGKALGEKPLALLCDGSVRYLDLRTISAATLKKAICGNDGNVLGADW